MTSRGRPKRSERVVEYRLHIWLIEGRDDDVISALEQVPSRARAAWIISRLRLGGLQNQTPRCDEDVEQLIDALDAMFL